MVKLKFFHDLVAGGAWPFLVRVVIRLPNRVTITYFSTIQRSSCSIYWYDAHVSRLEI